MSAVGRVIGSVLFVAIAAVGVWRLVAPRDAPAGAAAAPSAAGTAQMDDSRPASATCRMPAVAGTFYPSNPKQLETQVRAFLATGQPLGDGGRVVALISPHAGYPYSGSTAGRVYRTVENAGFNRIVVIAVSHNAAPAPVWVDDCMAYRTPLGDVPVDSTAVSALEREGLPVIAGSAEREHSLEVQLPFLQTALGRGWSLVPILVGGADFDDCARAAGAISSILDDDTLVCASSDFTHFGAQYGYTPFSGDANTIRAEIAKLDDGAAELIVKKNAKGFWQYVERTGATICGRGPITILLSLLAAPVEGHKIDYTTSGDTTGDYSMSVSYAGIVFAVGKGQGNHWIRKAKGDAAMSQPNQLTAEEKKTLLILARRSMETKVRGEKWPPEASDLALTPTLKDKRGAFVTLEERGQLRGCIGYVEAIKPLWQTVMENAVNAAAEDPRFEPVMPDELKSIHMEISAMTPMERITDVSRIEVGKHGIMLTRGFYRGLLLPQVATDYGWNRDEFLKHTCQKAGLPDTAWKDPATKIEIFSAEVFGEEEK